MLVFRRLVALPLFLCALPLVLLGALGIAVWMFADDVYGPLGPAQPQADREG